MNLFNIEYRRDSMANNPQGGKGGKKINKSWPGRGSKMLRNVLRAEEDEQKSVKKTSEDVRLTTSRQ